MEQYEVAEAFIEVLNANGVEHIFFNPGGEMAPIQTAISRYRVEGKKAPGLILCLDESVAMTAAHGHYMVSGKPQVVMVHAELGTIQVGGAWHNAQWGRVPVILWAGLEAAKQRKNWLQEPFDQGSMVRNFVKWDHQISKDEDIHDILQQAFQAALTEPTGPVYLTYPRSILTRKVDRIEISASFGSPIPVDNKADAEILDRVAGMLVEAENPLLVLGRTGRHPESMPILVELAETMCAPVLTSQVWMNFPTTHPLCAGIEQILGSRKGNPYLEDADVILVIDYDSPYAIAPGVPGTNAKIVYIDVDPLTQGRPLWGREADIFIKADSRELVPILNDLIKQKLTPERQEQFHERYQNLSRSHQKMRGEWHTLAMRGAKRKPITPDWLANCVAEIIDEDTILVNHTITQSAPVTEQIYHTESGTLLGCAGGSIQWALAAAMGAKVAAPNKTVISMLTDGGFVWGCPVATLWSACKYKASFLAIILNNQEYGVIKQLVESGSGEKVLSDEMAFEAGVDIVPPPDYAGIAQACGAYGRTVEEPTEVIPALVEALRKVRRGTPAVLDVRLERQTEMKIPV